MSKFTLAIGEIHISVMTLHTLDGSFSFFLTTFKISFPGN